MTQSLARVEPNGVRYQPTTIGTEQLGSIMVKSGFFKDTRDEAQAIVKILYGSELGFGPIASMLGCYIVDGRPSLSAQLIASAIQKSGTYRYRVREWTDTRCRIEFFERGESVGESTFSLDDASRAGLANKQTWKQYPKAMLWARAMSQGARAYAPDVFNGAIYTPDELQEDWEATTRDAIPAPPPEAYVPTVEQEVDDRDLVRSADERIWQRWEKLLSDARSLGLNPETVALPVERADLKFRGTALVEAISERQEQLDRDEAAHIVARANTAAGDRDEDLDRIEVARQKASGELR
jgi:hypothetical protein